MLSKQPVRLIAPVKKVGTCWKGAAERLTTQGCERCKISTILFIKKTNCCLRASAANTPTATSPEDVSHSRGRNVEGKES